MMAAKPSMGITYHEGHEVINSPTHVPTPTHSSLSTSRFARAWTSSQKDSK